MFNSLSGTVTGLNATSFYLLSSTGIEWLLQASQNTIRALHLNEQARVLVYTKYKEDDIKLFGFATERERSLFKNLLKVSGIGPKAALKAISAWEVESFFSALETGDASQIANLPGIGKKTAEKIVFTLKGKISNAEQAGPYTELVDSLIAMGFDSKLVRHVLNEILQDSSAQSLDESALLHKAIVKLSNYKH